MMGLKRISMNKPSFNRTSKLLKETESGPATGDSRKMDKVPSTRPDAALAAPYITSVQF